MSTQQALLWWKTLFSEIGFPGTKHSEPSLAKRAARRSKSLIKLFDELVDISNTDVLLEIGAHTADVSAAFVARGTNRSAYAYEASPKVYGRAVASGLPHNVKLIQKAIGRFAGDINFFEPTAENYESEWGSLSKRKGFESYHTIRVPMVTLQDAIIEAYKDQNPDKRIGLWIDVEGTAYDVLFSAGGLLNDRVSIIFVEINDSATYENSANSLKIISYMIEAGFVPVARDNEWQDAWNIIFVHQQILELLQESVTKWLTEEARLIISGL